jgi:hypothetical protein
MEITLNCSDPAVATIGECDVVIPNDRLFEFAAHATVLDSQPRSIKMIVNYTGDMFVFLYRHQIKEVWQELPKNVWDQRVLRHRKRVILRPQKQQQGRGHLSQGVRELGRGLV